jgi:hypothetical protein
VSCQRKQILLTAKEYDVMLKISRRSFLAVSAAAASGSSVLGFAKAAENIPGFDLTETDYDKTQVWKPFSDRKVLLADETAGK